MSIIRMLNLSFLIKIIFLCYLKENYYINFMLHFSKLSYVFFEVLENYVIINLFIFVKLTFFPFSFNYKFINFHLFIFLHIIFQTIIVNIFL
jgi:hypothetical protein